MHKLSNPLVVYSLLLKSHIVCLFVWFCFLKIGAKRPAATNGEMFPGKGNVLGSGTSSKPTLLQLWIAKQKANQKNESTSGQKTNQSSNKPPTSLGAPPSSSNKPPASLGAPPSSSNKPPASLGAPPSSSSDGHSPYAGENATKKTMSSSTDTSKQTKPEPTPLQKWISVNSDNIKKAVDKSPPSSSSTSSSSSSKGTSKVNGKVDKHKTRPTINPHVNPHVVKKYGKDAPSMQDKHQRKRSGKRQQLLAIFDSDSDSEDELFKAPPRKKPNLTGTNSSSSTSSTTASSSGSQTSLFSHVGDSSKTKPPLSESLLMNINGGINNTIKPTNPRHPHLPLNRPTLSNPPPSSRQSQSSTTSISSQSDTSPSSNTYVRPKPLFSGSNFPSPHNHLNTVGSVGGGIYGNTRPNSSIPGGSPSHSAAGNNAGTGAHSNSSTGPIGSVVTKTVQCPVCTMSVAELDINAHLDMCLS